MRFLARRDLIALALYLATFLALFVHLPLSGQLPGNTDTLLGISLSNLVQEKIEFWFSGLSRPTVFFPEPSFLPYGENCFGLMALFLFFKNAFSTSDIWAYYFCLSTAFALSSFGLFKLTTLFDVRSRVAFFAGLVYSLAGFTLGNVDDLNIVFVFFPAMSFYFIELGRRERSIRSIAIGSGLAGLQVWFGFYVFFFHSLALAIYAALNARDFAFAFRWRSAGLIAFAYAIACAPILAAYFYYHSFVEQNSIYTAYNDRIRQLTSLNWHHFWNVLPNNFLYSDSRNINDALDFSILSQLRKCCFPGFIFTAFAFLGSFRSKRHLWPHAIFVVFFTLSFGSNLPLFDTLTATGLGTYVRIPLRFYVFALLCASVFFAIGLGDLFERVLRRRGALAATAAMVVTGAFAILETTPFPVSGFALANEIDAPRSYVTHFSTRTEPAVVFDLPTNMRRVLPNGGRITTYSREILFMNYQTSHRQYVAGGVNAYQPRSRLLFDEAAAQLPSAEAIRRLHELGVEFLVFHKNLRLLPDEDYLDELKLSPALRLQFEDATLAILAY